MVFHFHYSEAIRSLESENEELMKDNTLAGSIQNQNQVLTLDRPSIFMVFLVGLFCKGQRMVNARLCETAKQAFFSASLRHFLLLRLRDCQLL